MSERFLYPYWLYLVIVFWIFCVLLSGGQHVSQFNPPIWEDEFRAFSHIDPLKWIRDTTLFDGKTFPGKRVSDL